MERKFIIMTDDGPGHKDVFLSWTTDSGGYYTTVDEVDEINEYDIHTSVKSAVARAKDADSGTLFGWPSPMKVMEILNYEEVKQGYEPELIEIQTVDLN